MKDEGFQSLGDIFSKKQEQKKTAIKPPAYQWQELALKIILEFNIPPFKKSSIFKVCRDHPMGYIERCLADTRELCQSGQKWRYFLKVVSEEKKQTENKEEKK